MERYHSPAVVDEIVKGLISTESEVRSTDLSILFADISGFTPMSESKKPEEVAEFLSHFFSCAVESIFAYGGTLDKFIGDGLMAVFGAPITREDDAARAVQAALQMLDSVRLRNAEAEGPSLDVGIGVNSGIVVAGGLGSARHTEYTCIGDVVNVAARLCALAGPGEILVGQGTAERLGSVERFEALPPVKLKGKAQPVPLFRVTPEIDAALRQMGRF
jgi:adenylate cyclase